MAESASLFATDEGSMMSSNSIHLSREQLRAEHKEHMRTLTHERMSKTHVKHCHCTEERPCAIRIAWREILATGYGPRWSMMQRRMVNTDSPFTYVDFDKRREEFRFLHLWQRVA